MHANDLTHDVLECGSATPTQDLTLGDAANNPAGSARTVPFVRRVYWLIDVLLIAMVGWGTSGLLA